MNTDPPVTETDDNDDDPIVKEIPIIHSKRLENNLYLFQYPLKRKGENNEMNIKKCFFKPENQQVKLEMGLDIEAPYFDRGRAEIIAHEVDGSSDSRKPNKQVYFENGLVDRVFLDSTQTVEDAHRYAIAAFNGKEIHLTTLKGILQFRPTFPYLEKGLRKRREPEAYNSDEEQAGPSTAQQVTVKFKHTNENDKLKMARDNSYQSLQARIAAEPWSECVWHGRNSTVSEVERLKLISDNTEDTGQAQNLTDNEYLRLLVPEDQEEATMEPTLPSHVLSLHALRSMSIQDQCRLLLKDAQIIPFHQLLMLLAGGEGLTADILLRTLPKVANVIRGNWVVKSEVLYPSNSFSATSGVPAELMCRTRDYVLYLFTQHQYVERKKVSSVMKTPAEEVKEIFMGISKLRHNKGWELSVATDTDFINKHSDIIAKQNQFWEQRYQQLTEFVKENQRTRRKSKSVSEDRRNGQSMSSDNESGTEKKSPVVARKNKKPKSKELEANL